MAKTKHTEIVITDDLKLSCTDSLDWQILERTAHKTWTPCGEFKRLENALEWLARKNADDGELYESLEAAVKAIKASNKKLARAIAAALESSE